jgi:uncharacterized protein (DUF1501 family)
VVATGLGQDTSTYPPGAAQILYSASAVLPAGSALDMSKSLEAVRSHLPAPLRSLQYSVSFNPSQTALDAARQTLLPQLLDDSRKLAQSLAAATGVQLGAIRSISDSAGAAGGVLGGAVQRSGDFTAILGVYAVLAASPSSTQYTFSINVIFATIP